MTSTKHWSSSCELKGNYKGGNVPSINSDRSKVDTFAGISVYSKLNGVIALELGWDAMTINLLSNSPDRVKVDTVVGLSLYSKLGRITAPELGWGTIVGDDPKARQGTKCDLHAEISSESPHVWIEP